MRLHVILLIAALAGVVGGAWLIGMWAVGVAVIADSAAVAAWALFHDDGQEPQAAIADDGMPADVRAFVEKVRRAS